jgi:hypothetical protein
LKRLLIILALAALPAAAEAQHAVTEIEAPRRVPGVTLTLTGHLLPSSGGALELPLSLLDRLADESALLSVDTAPAAGRVVVQVRFGFAGVAEFRRWYADERTVQLLREVRAATFGDSFETFVSYRPGTVP